MPSIMLSGALSCLLPLSGSPECSQVDSQCRHYLPVVLPMAMGLRWGLMGHLGCSCSCLVRVYWCCRVRRQGYTCTRHGCHDARHGQHNTKIQTEEGQVAKLRFL